MPVYDYKCQNHGLFYELAAMADAGKPAPCPNCGALSPQVIMVPPQIMDMAPEKRKAQSRNEKARHEPTVSSTESRLDERERREHKHGKGCGCHGDKEVASLRQQVVFLPDGSKIFPSQRPWMISH